MPDWSRGSSCWLCAHPAGLPAAQAGTRAVQGCAVPLLGSPFWWLRRLSEGGALHGHEVPPLPLAAHMANDPNGNMRSFFPLHP